MNGMKRKPSREVIDEYLAYAEHPSCSLSNMAIYLSRAVVEIVPVMESPDFKLRNGVTRGIDPFLVKGEIRAARWMIRKSGFEFMVLDAARLMMVVSDRGMLTDALNDEN